MGKREIILEELVSLFETVPVDGSDPYDFRWSVVSRIALSDTDIKGKNYALVLREGNEVKEEDIGIVRCSLSMDLEFYAARERGAITSSVANKVLVNLERRLRENRQLGGLTQDIVVSGNSLDIDDPNLEFCHGVVNVIVQYRHSNRDPRR